MIKVSRPTKIPNILTGRGATTTAENCKAYLKDKDDFLKKFEVDTTIYGSKTVKTALKNAQHHKCCFCEKDQGDEYGAVEHFRPKKGYKINRSQKKMTVPGYYWLAYSWDNLLFVCGPCNTGYKQTLFPLVDETRRASSHLSIVANEQPYLIDPCGVQNPRDHIRFDFHLPKHVDEYGRRTIEICGLDREALNNARAKLLNDIDARIVILSAKANHSQDEIGKAKQFLLDCRKPEAEFSSAAIDYLSRFVFV